MFYSEGQATFQSATKTEIPRGTLEIVFQEVLHVIWSIRGSYSAIWSIPLTNVKWHSEPWPTVTSQPIRLSTNFMTLIPSLTFTDSKWFPWSICNGCGMPTENAYHLVPSQFMGFAYAPNVDLFSRTCRVFSRLSTLNTPWYFPRFCILKLTFHSRCVIVM